VQGRHGIHGAHAAALAQRFQDIEVGPLPGRRNGGQFQPKRLGQQLEAGIAEGIDSDHVAGLQQRHGGGRQAVLGAVHQRHLLCTEAQAAASKMARHGLALMRPAAVRLIAQQRLQVAGSGQLAQRDTQQLGLAGQRRVVEVQIHHAGRGGMLVDRHATRQRRFAHEGAPAGFAADQAHGLQFRIHARGGDQRQPFARGQLAVRGQARARRQPAFADLSGQRVDQRLVAGVGHRSWAMYS
jgi:hypothetical protein